MSTVNSASRDRARGYPVAARASLATAALLLAGCGITGNLRMNEGYADFGSPRLPGADRELALSLGPVPVKMANFALIHDPIVSSILRDVRAVRVYVYEVDGDAALVRERIEETRDRFVADGWHAVLAVRDDGELVTALVKLDDPDEIRGVVVLVADDEEVVYVNAIGKIRPKTFDRVLDEFFADHRKRCDRAETSPASIALRASAPWSRC